MARLIINGNLTYSTSIRHAAVVGDPGTGRPHRHQVRLWHRPVRFCTVHIDGAPSVPVCTRQRSGRQADHDDRRPRRQRRADQGAEGWLEHDVPQCGYCQSGMIMAVTALLKDKRSRPTPTSTPRSRTSAAAAPSSRCAPQSTLQPRHKGNHDQRSENYPPHVHHQHCRGGGGLALAEHPVWVSLVHAADGLPRSTPGGRAPGRHRRRPHCALRNGTGTLTASHRWWPRNSSATGLR